MDKVTIEDIKKLLEDFALALGPCSPKDFTFNNWEEAEDEEEEEEDDDDDDEYREEYAAKIADTTRVAKFLSEKLYNQMSMMIPDGNDGASSFLTEMPESGMSFPVFPMRYFLARRLYTAQDINIKEIKDEILTVSLPENYNINLTMEDGNLVIFSIKELMPHVEEDFNEQFE